MTADDKAAVKSPAEAGGAIPPLTELKRLGKYLIEKKIGAGGMGAVFLARDTELKRTVALKVLPRDKAANPILVRRFRAEAQASAQLRHPNIVAVFDSGEADGFLYIAMEYVEGRDLFEMVALRGVVPVRRSIDIIKQVAAGLQHAFEQNIVHRDIKPSNLLIGRNGDVKVTDLGLARSIDDTLETNITRAGTTVGTVDYMSPEQARNSKLADIRSDLYSLGCTWYQMLTGSPPYPEGSVTNKLQAHAIKPIPDPRDKNPNVPEGLTAVIRRMMAKKPEDRYQTPADLIDELNHARLTQAAISREIFDEPTTDQDPSEEEGLSDDGYFEREEDHPTPDDVAVKGQAPVRKKSPRSTVDDEPIDTQPVFRSKPKPAANNEPDDEVEPESPGRKFKPKAGKPEANETSSTGTSSRSARARDFEEPDDEDEPETPGRKFKPKAAKPEPNETSSTGTSSRSARARDFEEEDEEDEPETPGRKFKPKAGKPEANEASSTGTNSRSARARDFDEPDDEAEPETPGRKLKPKAGKPEANEASSTATKPAESKPVDSKAADPKSTKPKGPPQKQMPPKRAPVEETVEGKSLLDSDLIRYVAAGGGVILLVAGVGWIISRFGGDDPIVKNPFGQPAEIADGNTSVPIRPGKAASAQSGDNTATAETNTVTGTSNPSTTKPEGTYDVDKIPDWAGKDVDASALQILTVGPAAKTATNFATLEEALQAAPAGGAVIRLQGVGPFPLPFVELTQRRRIVLASGSNQDRPLIVLKPAEGQTTAGLKLTDGILELRGLHFSIDRQIITGPLKVVEVVDGQLICQQCSFTSSGTPTDPAVALVVESTNDSTVVPRIEPNVLIDRVLVRGAGLGGLSIRRANVDAVLRDCLMVTGSATAIEVSGHIDAGAADVTTTKPRRILRFQRCTLSSQNRIFDMSVDGSQKPPQTAMVLRDTICAAQGVVNDSAIIFAGKWPQVRSKSESWLTKMTWTSTNTLYLGFEQLIDLGSSFKVVDPAAWQRAWNVRADARQFQKISFPETTLDELNVALPQEFNSNGLKYREIKSTDGGLPGCQVGKLSVPDVTSHQRAVAMASRPALPAAAVKSADPVQVRKVDMKKEDLGAVLSRGDWPSGTLFEASGGGVCQMSPTKIEGKSVRILFRQTEGASLRLQPLQPKSADAAKTVPTALISITRGTLELTNVVLEGAPNPKAMTPEWLIQATDSTLILNGCRLLGGGDGDGSRQLGLIRWMTAVPDQPGAESPALVVRECYLAGSGCGVRAECGQGAMIFRNSLLAIRGDALDLRPLRAGNGLLPVLDAENLTISATAAAIRFEAAPGTDPVAAPLRLFVDRCVFAPPLAFKAGEAANATLLQCVGPVIEQNQVEWWGTSNGVARQVVHLVRRDGDSGGPSDERTGLTAWKKLWDKTGSLRLLTGDKGVYLVGELPVRWKELKPGSFELHKNSQAVAWAEGQPIGVNSQAVEEASTVKKAGEAPKPIVTPNVPNKKNIGF